MFYHIDAGTKWHFQISFGMKIVIFWFEFHRHLYQRIQSTVNHWHSDLSWVFITATSYFGMLALHGGLLNKLSRFAMIANFYFWQIAEIVNFYPFWGSIMFHRLLYMFSHSVSVLLKYTTQNFIKVCLTYIWFFIKIKYGTFSNCTFWHIAHRTVPRHK